MLAVDRLVPDDWIFTTVLLCLAVVILGVILIVAAIAFTVRAARRRRDQTDSLLRQPSEDE